MIIGLCGRQRAGKDLASKIIRELNPSFTRLAFADPMRQAYYDLNPMITWDNLDDSPVYLQDIVFELGWDKAKELYPEVRRGLQRFGTEMGRNNFGKDFWVDLTWSKITGNTVITDVRFANEIKRVQKEGILWRIDRTDIEPEDLSLPKFQHDSEKDWREATPDAVIVNPGHAIFRQRVAIELSYLSKDV